MKLGAIFLMMLLLACNTSSKQENQEASKQVSELLTVNDFQTKCSELKGQGLDFNLVDVRTPEELKESGYLDGAVNIDFNAKTFKSDMSALDKNIPTLVYCRSGGRSGKTRLLLKELGFTEVYDLIGGITEWQTSGKPVVTNP